jgi:hypothetical protein
MDTFDYILKLNSIRDAIVCNEKRPMPSWVRITTITMCSKFLENIDLPKFKENFAKLGSVIVRRKGSTFRGFEWKMKETAFYNQVTIGYEDHSSRKSIKIFPNGSIQVAGCADLFDCRRIIRQLSFILGRVLECDHDIPVDEVSVKMINTNFSLNSSVNLNLIIANLSQMKIKTSENFAVAFKVSYNPDRYSAVKVKFAPGEGMKQVTASIFSTGKIIVTGAQTLAEIASAYEILNKAIGDGVLVRPVAQPEAFDTIMGAKFDEWVTVLKRSRGQF